MSLPNSSSPGPQQLSRSEPRVARILVAEDPFINSFLRTVLQRRGHKVVTTDPQRASEGLATGELSAELVITNCPEPFLPFAPSLRLVYIAAGPDGELASQFPFCRVLRKPFRNEDLLDAVEQLTALDVP